jgi:L-methionine (R)-S-oxide reductase
MKGNVVDKKTLFAELKEKVDEILAAEADRDKTLNRVCRLLADRVDYYNWVGFYLVENPEVEMLILGPFVGEPTEHVMIPFGKGICGQAAAVKETVIIQDVTKVSNYLSCAPDVRSEIVVPIFTAENRISGELDIDSHELAPFSFHDREFLEYICRRLTAYLDTAE